MKFTIHSLQLTTQKGFTLIELLVAVSIIGMLSALLLVNLQGTRSRARDTQRKNDLYQLKNALRMYYNDHQAYPGSTGDGNIEAGCGGADCSWGTSLFGTAAVPYMKVLPNDPLAVQDSTHYKYVYSSSGGDDYTLYACLENASDTDGETVTVDVCPSTKKYEVSND